AAARVKLLTPQAMLPRLKQGLDLLASTGRDRTDRQRTLRGAIAWSYDLLHEGMQRLFVRCAVFVGGAQLEQLQAVCGDAAGIGARDGVGSRPPLRSLARTPSSACARSGRSAGSSPGWAISPCSRTTVRRWPSRARSGIRRRSRLLRTTSRSRTRSRPTTWS